MLDAEAVLLVDDREPQPVEVDAFSEQRVRADRNRRLSAGELRDGRIARARALTAEDRLERDPQRQEKRREFACVLPREQLGRRHQCRLHAVARRQHDGARCDQRFAAADVALQQPVHWDVATHVAPNLQNHSPLRAGELKRQRALEAFEQASRNVQGASVVIAFALVAAQLRRGCQRQKLRKDESFARAFRFFGRARRVDGSVRLFERPVSTSRCQRRRQRIRWRGGQQSRKVLLYDCGDLAASEILRCAIDWDQLPAILFVFAELRIMRNVDDGAGQCSLDATSNEEPHPFPKTAEDETITADPFRDERVPVIVEQLDFNDLESANAPLPHDGNAADRILLSARFTEPYRRRRKAKVVVTKGQTIQERTRRNEPQLGKERRGLRSDTAKRSDLG